MTPKLLQLAWKSVTKRATVALQLALDGSSKALENMPNSTLFGAYCWPNTVSFPSSTDKHQAGGINQVDQVEDEVDTSEHSHCQALIPVTQPQPAAAFVGPLFRSTMLRIKVEDGPDNGCRQIEDHGQQSVGRQEPGKWEGEAAGALTDTEHDDDH